MDPFTEKDLIETLKAINLNLIEMNVRLEGIEKAIRESSIVEDSEEDFGEAVIEDEVESEEESEDEKGSEVTFTISEEDTETQEDFKPEF
jgi:hypothetical protein